MLNHNDICLWTLDSLCSNIHQVPAAVVQCSCRILSRSHQSLLLLSTSWTLIISLLLFLLLLLQSAHHLIQLAISNHRYLRAMNLKRLGAVLWFGGLVLLKLAQRRWRSFLLVLVLLSQVNCLFHHFLNSIVQILVFIS